MNVCLTYMKSAMKKKKKENTSLPYRAAKRILLGIDRKERAQQTAALSSISSCTSVSEVVFNTGVGVGRERERRNILVLSNCFKILHNNCQGR